MKRTRSTGQRPSAVRAASPQDDRHLEPRAAAAPAPKTPGPDAITRRGWTQRHLLDLDALSADELALVMRTAEVMEGVLRREVKKVPTLRGRTVMTLFYEPSTRTRVSFETAGKLLSAAVVNVSVQQSSVAKGESFLDTALTLQASAADVLVVRHPHAGAPYLVARHLQRTAVVNAGDGAHAHPTQALLDLYTLQRRLGSLQGRKVVMVGDAAHSRVARSNLWGLAKLGARVTLCAPPTLVPWDLLNGREQAPDHPFRNVEVESDLRTAVRGADVLMALRIQKERQRAGLIPSLREYAEHWQVTDEVMALAGPGALLMHPGPMNEGVEVSSSVAHGAQSVIEEQVTNGLAVRMAVLFLVAAPQESQRESA